MRWREPRRGEALLEVGSAYRLEAEGLFHHSPEVRQGPAAWMTGPPRRPADAMGAAILDASAGGNRAAEAAQDVVGALPATSPSRRAVRSRAVLNPYVEAHVF